MKDTCSVNEFTIGPNQPLTIIAGPCTIESSEINDVIARHLVGICSDLGMNFIFKGSFDKANRSSIHSPRGPGMESGLAELARVRDAFGVPITTDIHEPGQAEAVGAVVDLIQLPAFLCRQTDLLLASAKTGRPVNVKKGQFLSPREMGHVVEKLREGGCDDIMLTERGTFFGYHRLVNDFIGLGDLMELGPPVCFDVTHSTQLPGGDATSTAGRPDRAGLLNRAAVAAGVSCLFIECHPVPAEGFSDSSTMQTLEAVEQMLREAAAIRGALAGG